MRSLLYTTFDSLGITEQLVSEISGYSFFLGGIVLAVMILKRRMKFRGACLKLAPPMRWNDFEDYKHFPPTHKNK